MNWTDSVFFNQTQNLCFQNGAFIFTHIHANSDSIYKQRNLSSRKWRYCFLNGKLTKQSSAIAYIRGYVKTEDK